MAREAGRAVGPKNLADEEKQAFFAAVKLVAENATHKGDLDEAIDAYQLYSESERSGMETLASACQSLREERRPAQRPQCHPHDRAGAALQQL